MYQAIHVNNFLRKTQSSSHLITLATLFCNAAYQDSTTAIQTLERNIYFITIEFKCQVTYRFLGINYVNVKEGDNTNVTLLVAPWGRCQMHIGLIEIETREQTK